MTSIPHLDPVSLDPVSHVQAVPDTQPQGTDLIGGPFAVIESDPGVFSSLIRLLGVRGLEVTELYSIEPWAVDHLKPRGLVFCYAHQEDGEQYKEPADPDAERIWFANQVIDDACASQAILNIVFNCPDVNIGQRLSDFKRETLEFSSVLKGLAMSNSAFVRNAQNSLARPADLRGALNCVVGSAVDARKSQITTQPPTKKRKTNPKSPRKSAKLNSDGKSSNEEVFHYIGYVSALGKVWELDGLKSSPVEVGELYDPSSLPTKERSWTDVVRPALRMRMQKVGADNIRFTLLAIVQDQYEIASDNLEFLKRDYRALERRLTETTGPDWKNEVDLDLLTSSLYTLSGAPKPSFSQDFGQRRLIRDMEILNLPEENLTKAWENCVREAIAAKVRVDDELNKSSMENLDHVKRTHDYEPFIRAFVRELQGNGLLDVVLGTGKSG